MGASIQCANKNCFVAFHVTCARRARLFLRTKSTHGGIASLDQSSLKAYCDKHVPQDWRREQHVDEAIREAQLFYRFHMRDRVWADSQAAALSFSQAQQQYDMGSSPSNKRKRGQQAKSTWKLPSGAPVIPQSLYNVVESSLSRFMLRKRKEYSVEACKYWTLKRESRRGAALLKRLQLQMDTFSSMEITRRDFTAMGAAGRLKLLRRIEFATKLKQDLEALRALCASVKQREHDKLLEAELMREAVDTLYFPVAPLLWPILDKAFAYDGKGYFTEGFSLLRSRLESRYYTSVSLFSSDFVSLFDQPLELATSPARSLTADQKDRKKVAGRILRTVQPMLSDAKRKELELGGGKPFEKELQELDDMFNMNQLIRRDSLAYSVDEDSFHVDHLNGTRDSSLTDPSHQLETRMVNGTGQISPNSFAKSPNDVDSVPVAVHRNHIPLSPPSSSDGTALSWLHFGGRPWYLEPFDVHGVTMFEERWTGQEVLRELSEELSELDDEEMQGLEVESIPTASAPQKKKPAKKGRSRRWR